MMYCISVSNITTYLTSAINHKRNALPHDMTPNDDDGRMAALMLVTIFQLKFDNARDIHI